MTQSITTAQDMIESTQLIMKPYANWEQYLVPAPIAIAILVELVFISSKTDFSFNKNPPNNGYRYIRYPESFHASLMQVCDSGWWAFNEAHKSMDHIRLHTSTVPDYMKIAMKTLFQGSDEVVQALLPDQLENLRVIADDCVELASAAENKFTDVINIIQEILQACLNAEHFYGEELGEIKKKMGEAKMREEASREASERSKKAMKTMERELEDAQENWKKAMDSLSNGWEVIGMDFVEGITEGFTGVLNAIPPFLGKLFSKPSEDSDENTKGRDDAADDIDKISIYSKSGQILLLTEFIGRYIEGNTIDWKELYDPKKKYTNTDFAADQFKTIQDNLEKFPDCESKLKAILLCERGINLCQQLAEYAPTGQCSVNKTKEIISNWKKLIESALAFDSKSKSVTDSPSMMPKPPMMYKQESEGSGKKSAGDRASENAHFRIAQTQAQLDKTRDMYKQESEEFGKMPAGQGASEKPQLMYIQDSKGFRQKSAGERASENARFRIKQTQVQMNMARETHTKSVEDMERYQKELTDILVTMRSYEIKEIDLKTTIKILVEGMGAMSRVKEQWQKMVQFFQMVSNIVKVSLKTDLLDFVSTSKQTPKLSHNDKLFLKDQLYKLAFQASNIASLVHTISETYTEVSTKYLMDRVSRLGKLMAMDKSKPEFELEHVQLQRECNEAQKGILQMVLRNKEAFESSTDARLKKIERELLATLPAAAPEEYCIKEDVQAGFTEEEEHRVT